MWQEISSLWQGMQSALGFWEAVIAMGFSMLCSVICYLIYQLFYGSAHIGAGVHRMFLLGGPAITMLFLGIQTSIPLSLGLLGALSFVRFRTPVKDPAEIGFLLVLIASSVGSATGNFTATGMLFALVLAALGIRRLARNRISLGGRGNLMISVPQADFEGLEARLKGFLHPRLRHLRLETMSMVDDRVNLQYQYKRQPAYDWTAFVNELNQATSPVRVEVFVG